MAQLSGIPPKEKMKKIGEMWRAHTGKNKKQIKQNENKKI